MHKQAGDDIEIYDINHINDPAWYANLIDIKLNLGKQDVNLVKEFRKEDFDLKKKKPEEVSNLQINEGEGEQADLLIDEDIKSKGDIIAKANIVKQENQFVQEQVDTVLNSIAQIKTKEAEDKAALEKKKQDQKKKEAELRKKKKAGLTEDDDTMYTELEVNDTFGFFTYS